MSLLLLSFLPLLYNVHALRHIGGDDDALRQVGEDADAVPPDEWPPWQSPWKFPWRGVWRSPKPEAIVVVLRGLSDCHAKRLFGLVKTAGNNRHVWVLYDSQEPLVMDNFYMKRLRYAGLRVAKQPNMLKNSTSWFTFNTARSQHAKGSFLLWAMKHSNEYSYFWHLEPDTLFTGLWRTLFDAYRADKADIIAQTAGVARRSDLGTVYVKGLGDDVQNLTKVFWPLLRISPRLVNATVAALNAGQTKGHHEVVTPTVCQVLQHCSLVKISSKWIGVFELAGWGRYPNSSQCRDCSEVSSSAGLTCKAYSFNSLLRLNHLPNVVKPNTLWHPLKCELWKCGTDAVGDIALRFSQQNFAWVRSLTQLL